MLTEKETWLYLAELIEKGKLEDNGKSIFLKIVDERIFYKILQKENCFKGLCGMIKVLERLQIITKEAHLYVLTKIIQDLDKLRLKTNPEDFDYFLFPHTVEGWKKRIEYCNQKYIDCFV